MDLLLTLGHGSSAILVHKGHIVCGYEEERLSGVKADSRFPMNAIAECMKYGTGASSVQDVYVTHWDPFGELSGMKSKYWRPNMLPTHRKIFSHEYLTHHDTHAHAALWYAGAEPGMDVNNSMIFIIDGFGNYGEHISIYKVMSDGRPNLVKRHYGYDASLGLMYQYMTAFLGMKMHQDEYKILGYETHIWDEDVDMKCLHKIIASEVARYMEMLIKPSKVIARYDPVLSVDALPNYQLSLIKRWEEMCKELHIEDHTDRRARVILGYMVQSVLEQVVLALIQIYRPKNLIVGGGVFYNVKLNRQILGLKFLEKFCAFPLCGDQGNALGLYQIRNGDLTWPGHLNWGIRPSDTWQVPVADRFYTVENRKVAENLIDDCIKSYGFVNVVRDRMEFGPRALCNTSTLGTPRAGIVARINEANERNTIMPMAPVMMRSMYEALFKQQYWQKVHMSERHMITALPYVRQLGHIDGVMHEYKDEWTGRPQVIQPDDGLMSSLLMEHSVLINTSFNVHGWPIVFSREHAIQNHNFQSKYESGVSTVYIRGDGDGQVRRSSS